MQLLDFFKLNCFFVLFFFVSLLFILKTVQHCLIVENRDKNKLHNLIIIP